MKGDDLTCIPKPGNPRLEQEHFKSRQEGTHNAATLKQTGLGPIRGSGGQDIKLTSLSLDVYSGLRAT